jgi:hypothetical protein
MLMADDSRAAAGGTLAVRDCELSNHVALATLARYGHHEGARRSH